MIFSRTKVWPLLGLLGTLAAQAEEAAVQPQPDTNWTSYNENVNGQRFVNLNQITPANAAELPAAADEAKYYCGAETKKGTPCSRKVKGNVRCYQHEGMPAMLPASKLRIS